MMLALMNARVLLDEGFVDDQVVLVNGARIDAIIPRSDPRVAQAEPVDLEGALLLPGFVDCQVNGGGGVLFNDNPSVESIRTIGAAHRRFGTTSFLPTLISEDFTVIARAIKAVRQAIESRVPGVAGVHVEGPFINEARRGAHDSAKIRDLDTRDIALLSSLGVGRTLVTLAPEMTTHATLRHLAREGVVLSAGHTDGTFEEVSAALANGVRGVTHLFNAMSPLHHREPGAAGAALVDPECWCGLIVDGQHVHPAVLKIALAAKRAERFMLVTDAMPSVGSGQDSFMLQGRRIHVKDGICVDESGTLAGSAIDMATSVRNCVQMLGLPLERAARMASTYPAEFLGLGGEIGRIAPGYRANLVAMDAFFQVRTTWIDGAAS
ncbi:MAG: N-acetylglucosamine-6-phosphate deacetylase [Burkholderiales bacterium]|nr:N-acetylglucosamine-6-phosphate deacetylase [Burkholderiales bacterium]